MAATRHKLQRFKSPGLSNGNVGLEAAALDAERTSNSMDATGFDQLTIMVDHDGNTTGALVISVAVDQSDDKGTTWFPIQTGALAAGINTLSDRIDRKTVAGVDTWVINVPLNAAFFRIRISAAGGAATDTASVSLLLSSL